MRRVSLPGEGGILPVRRLLYDGQDAVFRPDVLVQREHIGRRIFLQGLEDVDCPKIFWAVDSHLNMAWQRWYARCFDMVLTPHASLFKALPSRWRPDIVRSFPWPGIRRAWRPHAERSHHAVFVGRIDVNRPQRGQFAALLQRHSVAPCTLAFADMLTLYDDTRVLPNECIADEFNFRIMEGASCGCCVLTPDMGDDLRAAFTPDREVLTYRHAQELDEQLTFLRARPSLTERIGRAAQKRVQAQHLAEHRAAALVSFCHTLPQHSRPKEDIRRALALACLQWARGDMTLRAHLPQLLPLLAHLEEHPDVTAMRLRLALEEHRLDAVRRLLTCLAPIPLPEGSTLPPELLDAHTACAVAADTLGDMAMFLRYWRQWRHLCPETPDPTTLFEGCLAWATLLERTGCLCQPGFTFVAGQHCPETALEMLLLAERHIADAADRSQWLHRVTRCCERTPLHMLSMSFHDEVRRNSPHDWRAALSFALACLRVYRLDDGLEAARAAQHLAHTAGEDAAFAKERAIHGLRL